MFNVRALLAATAAATMIASSAQAAISYSYTIPSSSYSVQIGQSVTIPVYLQETLNGGSTSLINADGGVFGVGFLVNQTSGGTGTITGIAGSTTSNGANFAGGTFSTDPSDSTTHVGGLDLASFSAASGPMTNSSGQIEIGTVTIMPQSVGATNFVLANYKYPATTGGYTITFGNGPGASQGGFDLDVSQSGANAYTGASASPETFTVTATAVPEPTVLSLAGIGAFGLVRRRRQMA
jgi:hypothetical protein